MSHTLKNPFISIVLPTYNAGKYIDRCLQSCVNQTYERIEIIVVNDCGQDDSIIKAEKWALKDNRIKIVHNTNNLGTFHARRIGTEAANGIYVLYLDPDDELANDTAEAICNSTKGEEIDAIFFGIQYVPKPNSVLRKPGLPRQKSNDKSPVKTILRTRNLNYGTPGKAYLTSTARRAFKYLEVEQSTRLVYAEDALLFYAVLVHTNSFSCIQEFLYIYHRNDGSITNNSSNESRLFKSNQIGLVVTIISRKIQSDILKNCIISPIISNKIIGKLISDKHLLERYCLDPTTGKQKYLSSVTSSMLSRKSLADAVRIIVYFLSAGKKKL